MLFRMSQRSWFFTAAACCAALLGFALYKQHVDFLDPCPLCVLQRVAFIWIGIWALLSWRVAWGALGIVPYQFASNWVLSSVPTFLFMGFICYHTRLTQGLFDAATFDL